MDANNASKLHVLPDQQGSLRTLDETGAALQHSMTRVPPSCSCDDVLLDVGSRPSSMCSTMNFKQPSGRVYACCPAAYAAQHAPPARPMPRMRSSASAGAHLPLPRARLVLGPGTSCGLRDRYPTAITIARRRMRV
jgi:hypothetical protein